MATILTTPQRIHKNSNWISRVPGRPFDSDRTIAIRDIVGLMSPPPITLPRPLRSSRRDGGFVQVPPPTPLNSFDIPGLQGPEPLVLRRLSRQRLTKPQAHHGTAEGGVVEQPLELRRQRQSVYAYALVTPLAAAAIGFLCGLAGTVLVFQLADIDSSGEGAGLGVLLVFLGVSMASFLVASVGVAAWLSRRSAMDGRNRIGLAAMFAGWLPATAVAGVAMAWFMDRAGLAQVGGVLFALCVGATLIVAVVQSDHRALLASALVGLVFVGATVLLEDGHRRGMYSSGPPPATGLVDTEQLASALPGWELLGYGDDPGKAWRPPHSEARILTDQGVEITIGFYSERASCETPDDCSLLEPLADGSPVVLRTDYATCGGVPTAVSVFANQPSGRWSVYSSSRCREPLKPTVDELRALLSTVTPLPLDEWIRAT